MNFERAADPTFRDGDLGLGQVYARLERWTEAESHFREAGKVHPESVEAHYGFAQALKRSGKPPEANREFAAVKPLLAFQQRRTLAVFTHGQ